MTQRKKIIALLYGQGWLLKILKILQKSLFETAGIL